LDHTLEGRRPRFGLGVAVAPTVDRFRGALDLQASAYGTLGWNPFRRWEFGLRGSTASSFGWQGDSVGDGPHTLVHGIAATARYAFTDRIHASAAVGSTWQLTEREDLPEFRED